LFLPFVYLSAKHMVTGHDHLLCLLGVIFFCYWMKDIGIYVTMFAIGHSATLMIGVLAQVSVSSYLVEAEFVVRCVTALKLPPGSRRGSPVHRKASASAGSSCAAENRTGRRSPRACFEVSDRRC
jgi:HupE / UreJ protein